MYNFLPVLCAGVIFLSSSALAQTGALSSEQTGDFRSSQTGSPSYSSQVDTRISTLQCSGSGSITEIDIATQGSATYEDALCPDVLLETTFYCGSKRKCERTENKYNCTTQSCLDRRSALCSQACADFAAANPRPSGPQHGDEYTCQHAPGVYRDKPMSCNPYTRVVSGEFICKCGAEFHESTSGWGFGCPF